MRFRLIGGDGDQSYFSGKPELEAVTRDWFNADTDWGEAKLVQVATGQHKGTYVALTSRVVASIDDQLGGYRYASVIFNVVTMPGPGFRPTRAHLDAVGMCVVELIS
jgi:hypothetical protein